MPRLVAAFVRVHLGTAAPGLVGLAVFALWAENNGGYDPGTWYWGALVLLSLLALTVVAYRRDRALPRLARWALGCFALYVLWSYASIAWAASPGDALEGSNRALLYLIVFALFVAIPWTAPGALAALVGYVLAVGAIAIVLLWRLATGDQIANLVIEGRLAAPTGYFNSSVALFTVMALLATALYTRRELPGVLRGLLIALACAGLQLALIGQSRGWLLTLPLILVVAIILSRERFRAAGAALIPIAAALIPVRALLGVFNGSTGVALDHVAEHAGRTALAWCVGAFVIGTALAWIDGVVAAPKILPQRLRAVGAIVVTVAVLAACAGAVAATHGHPVRFMQQQLHGFTHEETGGTTSHFATVGSARYDFWRVSLKAFLANPLTGLGQDNFADYYILHRRTPEDPSWPHSLEMRLLAMTGIVGFVLFAGFLVASLTLAIRAVTRSRGLRAAVIATALLPLVDWLIHGSVDWLFEMPALTGPALAFLGIAVALSTPAIVLSTPAIVLSTPAEASPAQTVAGSGDVAGARGRRRARHARRSRARLVWPALAGLALIAAVVVLGFPYLAAREEVRAGNLRSTNPEAALADLALASRFDPLAAAPGRLAGTIALQDGLYEEAEARYQQAIDREPGGWFAWFGQGLAASALGQRRLARRDFEAAARIEKREQVIQEALARVDGATPLTPNAALSMVVPEA